VTAAQGFAALQVEPVGFEAVADEGSQAEVSRLFSAMLQLINNGNIQILPGQAQQPFQLRLLKTELLHRQFLEGPAITAHASKVKLFSQRLCLRKDLTVLSTSVYSMSVALHLEFGLFHTSLLQLDVS